MMNPAHFFQGLQKVLTHVHGMGADPEVDPFWYYASTTNLLNNGTDTISLRIESDAHFVWTHAAARVIYTGSKAPVLGVMSDGTDKLTGGAGTSWPIRCKLHTTSNGRDMMSASVPLSLVFGADVALPFRLPRPKALGKSTTLSIELERYGIGSVEADGATGQAAPANLGFDVELAFMGVKVYNPTRQDLTGLPN